jgi:glycosyltransferase involved in cell wall biosynthesis
MRIVIPAYNEEKYIGKLLDDLVCFRKTSSIKFKITVLNDGSIDKTKDVVEKYAKYPFIDLVNLVHGGKGHVIKNAFRMFENEKIILMDGDGQHAVKDLRKFFQAMKKYDFVIGQRDFKLMPPQRRFSNRMSSLAVYLSKKVRIRDVLSGYRAINLKKMKTKDFIVRGYEIEIEMIEKAADNNLSFGTVKIHTNYETGSRMPFIKSVKYMFYLGKKVLKAFLKSW